MEATFRTAQALIPHTATDRPATPLSFDDGQRLICCVL